MKICSDGAPHVCCCLLSPPVPAHTSLHCPLCFSFHLLIGNFSMASAALLAYLFPHFGCCICPWRAASPINMNAHGGHSWRLGSPSEAPGICEGYLCHTPRMCREPIRRGKKCCIFTDAIVPVVASQQLFFGLCLSWVVKVTWAWWYTGVIDVFPNYQANYQQRGNSVNSDDHPANHSVD